MSKLKQLKSKIAKARQNLHKQVEDLEKDADDINEALSPSQPKKKVEESMMQSPLKEQI